MKCKAVLLVSLGLSSLLSAQSLVNGTNYADLFGPPGANVTVNPTNALVLTLGGSASGGLGTYWDASATGGVSALAGTAESGAQVALDGSNLQFRVSNTGLVGDLVDLGLSGLTTSWSATATFDKIGSELILQPNTTYRVSFFVDGNGGLLNSVLGVFPTLSVELLDGEMNNIGTASSVTLVNVVGLLGGTPTDTVEVEFVTGSSVDSGPASLRFNGGVTLNPTALGSGNNFATFSGIEIVQVPEPSVFGLVGIGALALLRRRR